MLDNVTGNVGVHLAVGATASLLCILLIMGLKLKWFRARMTFEQPTTQQEAPSVGVYRSRFYSDFDSPSTSSFAPQPPSPKPPSQPPPLRIATTVTPGPSKLDQVQADAKEDKSKKIKESKPKVPKEKAVKTKPPKAAKLKAPKLPSDVKSELLKTTENKTKTKSGKRQAPQATKEVTTTVPNPADKVKVTKEPKHKSKSKDNTGNQLSNGIVKTGNNILSQDEDEVVSPTNAFLLVRPANKTVAQGEASDGVLTYEEDLFARGQSRAMKTFSSMMPTKTQVDLSVSPIPRYDASTPRAIRNPIAAGVTSYRPPRDGTGVDMQTSASVYVNMNVQSTASDRPFLLDLEDESET